MSRTLCVFTAVVWVVSCAAGQTVASPSKLDSLLTTEEFVQDWKISKQFTLDVADAMPAEFYNFKPNPDEMTFGEQMAHIAIGNVFRFTQITGAPAPFVVDLSKPPITDKAAVMKMLEQSFDYVIAVIPQITPEQLKHKWHLPTWKGRTDPDGRAMLINMLVHTAHHRAQCEVY